MVREGKLPFTGFGGQIGIHQADTEGRTVYSEEDSGGSLVGLVMLR